ncbi:HAD hydrolase-like protein [Candidatus Poribacteria bacterium]|nr:HAD hydrolase-like protein [Candidatus Poribacteria bacterium]
MKKLVLFDIDGTILNAGRIGRRAIYQALEDVFGADKRNEFRDIRMSGKTDTQIIHEILEDVVDRNALQQLLPRIFDSITDLLAAACKQRENTKLLVGVQELIEVATDHKDCTLGLLTGNNKQCAMVKLDVFELTHFFQLGAFGDEAYYRNELPDIAVQRAFEQTGHLFRNKEIVILGDTPNDVSCGRHLGVCAIAVATGRFSSEELQKSQPDYLFEDLSDTRSVMNAILT